MIVFVFYKVCPGILFSLQVSSWAIFKGLVNTSFEISPIPIPECMHLCSTGQLFGTLHISLDIRHNMSFTMVFNVNRHELPNNHLANAFKWFVLEEDLLLESR